MTLAPRFLVRFFARWRATQLRRALAQDTRGIGAQAQAFQRLTGQISRTSYGRDHGIHPGIDIYKFRAQVPLRTPAQLRPWVERMAGGEADVLWPGRCRLFVYTAGTTDGTPKMLPVTGEMLGHFRTALRDAVLLHALRIGSPRVFLGRHVHTGPSADVTEAGGAYAGYLDGIATLALSPWTRANLHSPSPKIARLPEGPEKTRAIAEALENAKVTLVGGLPESILALAQTIRERSADKRAALESAWPALECCLHTGALPTMRVEELKTAAGSRVSLHEVYAAAEGIYAAQDTESAQGLRLLASHGVYFEFLPLGAYDENLPIGSGENCVSVDHLQVGPEYVLVVTTPSGLCRSVTDDVVKVTSLDPLRIAVVGRASMQLKAFGENLGEREVTEVLLNVCARNGWQPVNFHVAPYFVRTMPKPQGRHEWWIELRPGTARTPTGPLLAADLDAELASRNRSYANRRQGGWLEAPTVRLVMPGVFDQWARTYPVRGGIGKYARCRSDRHVADQLAGLTRFHAGTVAPFVISG
jgi:hypothetical protein